jgi:polar amino acid transport system permease protein
MEPVLWFGWFRADIIAEYSVLFWRGLLMTVGVTVICIVQGTALGLLIGMARLAEARHAPARQLCLYALRWPATIYVSFFRGTPLFVQILLMHFALLPVFINPSDGLLISGDAARHLKQNYGALLSGVSFPRTMYHVVLPQAFRRMLPPLGNNAISLLKDSSLISAIGLAELAYAARTVAGAYSRYWEPYLTISLMYWFLTLGLALLVKKLEDRYGRGDTR